MNPVDPERPRSWDFRHRVNEHALRRCRFWKTGKSLQKQEFASTFKSQKGRIVK